MKAFMPALVLILAATIALEAIRAIRSPSTHEAQAGWVLWRSVRSLQDVSVSSERWFIEEAVPAFDECIQLRDEEVKKFTENAEQLSQRAQKGDIYSVVTTRVNDDELMVKLSNAPSDSLPSSWRWRCLPGALDPRPRPN